LVSRSKWTAPIAAIAGLLVAAGGADAAPAPGPEAVARAYVAAVRAHDAHRLCALQDAGAEPRDGYSCLAQMREDGQTPARARVGAVFQKGTRARLVVDLVFTYSTATPDVVRSRMLLRRRAGRWLVVDSGLLPGLYTAADPRADPRPAGRSAALRRLADDELLALSGGGNDLMCDLLAPGAPLGGVGGCRAAGRARFSVARRLARLTVTSTDATHARLSATVAVDRAIRTRRRPGWARRTTTHRDTLFAVKVRSGWRLVKPSRDFYRVVGVPAPTDVGSSAPTATWPMGDATLPSVSERPIPAGCRTPPALWDLRACDGIGGLAVAPRPAGDGVVAWTDGLGTRTRVVGAGTALAPASTVTPPDSELLWNVVGLSPVAGGQLLVEDAGATLGVRATPLDADGRPRGAPVEVFKGYENPEDGSGSTVAVGPPDARVVGVIVEDDVVRRLGPDGRVVAPDVPRRDGTGEIVVEPDGSLLSIAADGNGAVSVQRLGADGRPAGATVGQPPLHTSAETGLRVGDVAEDAGGRLLMAWREDDGHGHGVIRAWRYDPAAPNVGTVRTVARVSVAKIVEDSYERPEQLAVLALPGGGWGVTYSARTRDALPVRALRLDPSGAPTAAPRLVAPTATGTGYGSGEDALGLAGDSVVWIAPPLVAGLPQVRVAPLP
jgi:hypothetical protein